MLIDRRSLHHHIIPIPISSHTWSSSALRLTFSQALKHKGSGIHSISNPAPFRLYMPYHLSISPSLEEIYSLFKVWNRTVVSVLINRSSASFDFESVKETLQPTAMFNYGRSDFMRYRFSWLYSPCVYCFANPSPLFLFALTAYLDRATIKYP